MSARTRAAAALLALAPGCAWRLGPPTVHYGEEPASLTLVHPSTDRDRWYVPIEVAPGQTWLLFVDTGYSFTTCDDDFARALDLPTRGRARVRGELGVLDTTKARLPDIQVGDHTLEGLVCMVRDLDGTSSISDPPEIPVAGVLGIDWLRPFRVEMDPGAGALRLSDPRTAPPLARGPHTVPLRREPLFGARVTGPLTVEGRTLRPILDTGATDTYVDGARLGLSPSRTDYGVPIRGSGVGGEGVEDRITYRVPRLDFAGHPMGPMDLYGRVHGPLGAGLLGLDVLDRFALTLDFRAHRLHVRATGDPADRPSWTSWSRDGEPAIRILPDPPPED